MGDLKEIKSWRKKVMPHIFALEPRMLFDGVSILPPENIDTLIAPPKIISVVDSITGQQISNGTIVNDIQPIVRVDIHETQVLVGDILKLYNGQDVNTSLAENHIISESDIQNGFVDLKTLPLSNGGAYQLTAVIYEQDQQTNFSQSFDIQEGLIKDTYSLSQFDVQNISLVNSDYENNLIQALNDTNLLLTNLSNQPNYQDLFQSFFGLVGTDTGIFSKNLIQLMNQLSSEGLHLKVQILSGEELKGAMASFAAPKKI